MKKKKKNHGARFLYELTASKNNPGMTIVLPSVYSQSGSQPGPSIPVNVTPPAPFASYLPSLKVFLLQLQAVGPPGPSDHFGDSVGYLLHGAFHSIHCRPFLTAAE